ncbi:MAG TPA: ATP-binding protein [Phycisphaerae bacterium]|nr:ATP-binding protein [Phycisphaerae bacterium]
MGSEFRLEVDEQLALLEALWQKAPVGFALVDRDFRYLRANSALMEIAHLKGTASELVGKRVQDVVPGLWPLLEPLYGMALAGETILNHEVSGMLREGEESVWHRLVSYYPVRLKEEIIGVGVIISDITERKAAENALALRTKLYVMLSRMNAAVNRCRSSDELFREICRVAVETGGFRFAWVGVREGTKVIIAAWAGSDGGYMNRILISLDENDARSRGPTGRAFLTGEAHVVNDFMQEASMMPWREDAKRSGIGASASFPLKEDGKVVATLSLYAGEPGFFTEDLVTTLKEIIPSVSFALDGFVQQRERALVEEQFRQAQKMEAIGQLAGGVAHDFNNQLTILFGYAYMILDSMQPEDPNRESLLEIIKVGERSAALTNQLLAFSRKQVMAPMALNLNDVVHGTEKMLEMLVGEDVEFTRDLCPTLISVKADIGKMEQALMNLVVNARDAMPRGGRLRIETKNVAMDGHAARLHGVAAGEYAVLIVSDTGTGMTPEVRERIFEPFFTTKPPGKGTGLGLAMVHGIVRQSGGHIEVESKVDAGTTFWIYLPRAEAAAEWGRAEGVESEGKGRSATILLVEDEEALRSLARRVLVEQGFRVMDARNGEEAEKLVEESIGEIDLLVTDVVMPGIGGRVLAERLRERHSGLKVLYISGYTEDAVVRQGILQDEVNFLQKPFSPRALAQMVGEVLRER